MLARVFSCAVIGLDGVVIEVEVDYFQGMTIVGLPDAAVQENRERVQAAVRNAGVPYPCKRLVVNLAPASVCKERPAYDLPIALGVLPASAAEGTMLVGGFPWTAPCTMPAASCRRTSPKRCSTTRAP